ncbi:hypothetical protein P3342_001469 [Pyrenophora teres f. teres]|nr:hypothetical protein P3342_001469 [Pyrenophora teres f. teres]
MNPAHRDGWPPTQAAVSGQSQQQTEQSQGQAPRSLGPYGPNNANPQAPPHASSAQASGPVLPQPSGGGYYSSGAATAHNQNLPALPGLTAQPQHSSPHMSAQRPPSSDAGAQGHQGPPGPPYSLPEISQTLQQQHQQQHQQQQQQQHMPTSEQANADREREMRERETREREMDSHAMHQQEDHVKREAEQRDRELHERQQREHAAHQSHSTPMQIHQPVAVAPSTRTIHGPNGLLGQSGPINGPNPLAPPMGGPNAAGQMYGNSALFSTSKLPQGCNMQCKRQHRRRC